MAPVRARTDAASPIHDEIEHAVRPARQSKGASRRLASDLSSGCTDQRPLRRGSTPMQAIACCLVAVLVAAVAVAEPSQLTAPQTVEIPSGNLHLKAYLWKPAGSGPFPAVLFNHGSGGADAAHTAGMPITEAAERLAPLFLKHGYAFLYLFRRGQGLSADQAPFLQDLLQREEVARGKEARQHL